MAFAEYAPTPRRFRACAHSLIPGLVFLCAAFPLACAGSAVETACSGLSDRRVGITGEEYAPCATEIMAALDTLQGQLRRLVSGDTIVRSQARTTERRLRRLIKEIDLTDPLTETLLRWPDQKLRSFNSSASDAAMKYSSTLRRWDDWSFNQGSRSHGKAKSLYLQIR